MLEHGGLTNVLALAALVQHLLRPTHSPVAIREGLRPQEKTLRVGGLNRPCGPDGTDEEEHERG